MSALAKRLDELTLNDLWKMGKHELIECIRQVMYENSVLQEKIEEFSKGRTVRISYVKGRNLD